MRDEEGKIVKLSAQKEFGEESNNFTGVVKFANNREAPFEAFGEFKLGDKVMCYIDDEGMITRMQVIP